MLALSTLPAMALATVAMLITTDGVPSREHAGRTAAAPAAPNVIAGRVTMADGTPLRGEISDITVRINGVSMAGERVSYTPVVRPDGRYSQRVAPGQYRVQNATISITFGGVTFTLPLEPVGTLFNKNRDAAAGITQDFVWKVTGANLYSAGQPDPNNHTHWYGMSLGMAFQTYRSDLNRSATVPPAGTRLVFTATATSRTIDGRTLPPVTIERLFSPAATRRNDDLNDLVPANYDITGVAILPDGTRRPIRFQGKGNYPNYVATLKASLETGTVGGIDKQLAGWAID